MDGQQRLYRLAVEAVAITAHYEPGRGWRAVVRLRRGDETWSATRPTTYEALTSPELVDVLGEELAAAFGL